MDTLPIPSDAVAIVADDLTSAADGALPFHRRGLDCEIYRSRPRVSSDATGKVLAVDTDSRSMTELAARDAVSGAVEALRSRPILLKTIDSTLRGNIQAEISAAFLASGRQRVVIAPAFPAAGRTTVGGIQLVHGEPVNETVYGADPAHPAHTARIADLVDTSLSRVCHFPSSGADENQRVRGQLSRLTVLDARTQDELNLSVRQFPDPRRILWVGSPGLSQAVAGFFSRRKRRLDPYVAQRVLVVVGSANPTSRQQLRVLMNAGVPVAAAARDLPGEMATVCLATPEARSHYPWAILRDLALEAGRAVRSGGFDAIVATGGATIDGILEHLAVERLYLLGELEAGFPIARARNSVGWRKDLVIAMKAGGFGTPTTLVDAIYQLSSGLAHSKGEQE